MSLLAGRRVLVTRPVQPGDRLPALLAEHGALPLLFPTIAIIPDEVQLAYLDQALLRLHDYGWLIFTSQQAVALFCERFDKSQIAREAAQPVKIAAIGPATARALTERGFSVQFVPDEHIGEAVANGLGDVRGQKVLLPRAQAAREALANLLVEKGAIVDEIPLYQTVTHRPEPAAWRALERGVDYVTFTSASTVHGFFELLGERAPAVLEKAAPACIGPVTAEAVAEHGIRARVVARQYTAEGLVQAMLEDAEKHKQEVIG